MRPLAQALTEEFYAWELRGRGWDTWPGPVPLEPPFRPFLFHGETVPRGGVDDGRHETVGSRLADGVRRLLGIGPPPTPPSLPALDAIEEPRVRLIEPRKDLREILVRVPQDLRGTQDTAVRFLTSLGALSYPISFEVIGSGDSIAFGVTCGASDEALVRGLLEAYHPEIEIGDGWSFERLWSGSGPESLVVEFGLAEEFMLPLAIPPADSLIPIVAALDQLEDGECAVYQVLSSPARHPWSESIWRATSDGSGGCFFRNAPGFMDLVREKMRTPLAAAVVRLGVRSGDRDRSWQIARSLGAGLAHLEHPGGNQLVPLEPGELGHGELETALLNRSTFRSGMILSLRELAALAHFPDQTVISSRIDRPLLATKAAPAAATGGPLTLGVNRHRGASQEVTLTEDERSRHIYIIGASGTGKSSLLLSLISQDLAAGRGCAVLDPHGDLVDEVLARVPEDRIDETILFDPSDPAAPVSFNVLEARDETESALLESDLAGIFRRMATSWGDQMTAVLANAVGAILASPEGGSLADLRRFLADRAFREELLRTVEDTSVVDFWQREFPLLSGRPEASILTRLNSLLRTKMLRDVVSPRRGRLDLSQVMNEGGILLGRLPSGLMGEENAHLLGSLLVAKIHQVAIARQRIAASERAPFTLYIDEFHRFVTPTMASILEGARKYALGLVLAHQTLRQVGNDEVVSSALANAHTRICFRLGHEDARRLADGFSGFSALDLEDLETGQAIARIGQGRKDFTLGTSLRGPGFRERADEVREASRARYGIARKAAAPRTGASDGLPNVPEIPDPEIAHPPTRRPPPVWEKVQLPTTEDPLPGRGGAEHKYLQQLVSRLAHDRGWRASIEHALPNQGRVDVALKRDEMRIAVEVSVSTGVSHEIENLRKCLGAGFESALLVVLDSRAQARCRDAIARALGDRAERTSVLRPEELTGFLDERLAPRDATGTEVRGYRVRLARGSRAESGDPSEAIARVIAKSVRRLKKNP